MIFMPANKNKKLEKAVGEELSFFESKAGGLPTLQEKERFKSVGAVWVVSGAGSYLHPIIDTPSDNIYKKHKWYSGQDKKRLDYAARWLAEFENQYGYSPTLIYNGTVAQDKDLLQAIGKKKINIRSKIFIPEGEIVNTLDQVKNFLLPDEFDPRKMTLAVLSHSAHLPRILRFMSRFPEGFKGAKVIALSINVTDEAGQSKMKKAELENLSRYVENDNASMFPYPFCRDLGEVEISKITAKDVMDVFDLSNQPSVRDASFNQNKINLGDHKKWFEGKLKDKNAIILKAVILGCLAGQARLEIEGAEALVGISTSEKFRGRGVASKLLQAIICEARGRKIKTINALIKSDNIASIGLFEKNGWVYVNDCVQHGIDAKKFIYRI